MVPIRLSLLPIESLLPHETIVHKHAEGLFHQITTAESIRNPIPVFETENQYIVLDGHHRLETLKEIGVTFAPVQVVSYEQIRMGHWYHVIDEKWHPEKKSDPFSGRRLLGTSYTKEGLVPVFIPDQIDGETIFQAVWDQYNSYKQHGFTRKYEVSTEDFWFVYDGITFEDVLSVAKKGLTFPPGISRFHISYRILNLNVPLSLLYSGDSEVWQLLCQNASNGRVYDEPVICVE